MRSALLSIVLAACVSQADERDATLSLDAHTWTAGALFTDVLEAPSITISLAHRADHDECSWFGPESVDISLPIDGRREPHVVPGFDLAVPNTGSVFFTDEDQNLVRAVSGRVTPTLTGWGPNPDTRRLTQVAQVDGTLDVVLEDGRHLSGDFRATACATSSSR